MDRVALPAPALAAQRLFGLYQDQARLYDEQLSLYAEPEAANTRFRTPTCPSPLRSLPRLRPATVHSRSLTRRRHLFSDIAENMGLSEDEQERAFLCGLVHDIGKIGLPGDSSRQGRTSHS